MTLRYTVIQAYEGNSWVMKGSKCLKTEFIVCDIEGASCDAILGEDVAIPVDDDSRRDAAVLEYQTSKSDPGLPIPAAPRPTDQFGKMAWDLSTTDGRLQSNNSSPRLLGPWVPEEYQQGFRYPDLTAFDIYPAAYPAEYLAENPTKETSGSQSTIAPEPLPRVTVIFIGPSCSGKTSLM